MIKNFLLGQFYSFSSISGRVCAKDTLLPELRKIIESLGSTSKSTEKLFILRNASVPIKSFLHFYNKCGPLHVTSHSILKSEKTILKDKIKEKENEDSSIVYNNIEELMQALSNRMITGNAALSCVAQYITENEEYKSLILDLIDRNLKVGLGPALLSKINEEGKIEEEGEISIPITNCPSSQRHVKTESQRIMEENKKNKKTFPVTSKELPVALGYSLDKVNLSNVHSPSSETKWLLSRKLDGIRCLAHFRNGGITMRSRSGTFFGNLLQIKQELVSLGRKISECSSLIEFYFDGELCVFDDESGIGSSGNSKEDFRKALSLVRSQSTNLPLHLLSFHIFDLFTPDPTTLLSNLKLAERLDILNSAHQQVKGNLERVAVLDQTLLNDPHEFQNYLPQSREGGWEGLIIRKDSPHIAKRSKDIIKVKDFYEAEFPIIDYKLEEMNITENGRHGREMLLSAVKVRLDENVDVWVGSGFGLEERRRYAQSPSLLKDAIATVRYFQKSSSKDRPSAHKSLRFPIIKAIFEGNTRNM